MKLTPAKVPHCLDQRPDRGLAVCESWILAPVPDTLPISHLQRPATVGHRPVPCSVRCWAVAEPGAFCPQQRFLADCRRHVPDGKRERERDMFINSPIETLTKWQLIVWIKPPQRKSYRLCRIFECNHHRPVLVVDWPDRRVLVLLCYVLGDNRLVVALRQRLRQIANEQRNVRSVRILLVLQIESHQLHLADRVFAQLLHNLPRPFVPR